MSNGFSVIEITVVLSVLLILLAVSVFTFGTWREWKLGAEAGTTLRSVHNAQRTYLAEHPTEKVEDLTAEKVGPYLATASQNDDDDWVFPTVEDLDGNQLPIKLNVYPPVIDDGSEDGYDPSGNPDDGQWDVGG